MEIIVCVKQVPDTADIKWTENNTICRDGVESIVNPCDLYASETALKIKDEKPETKITAISMGPVQAKNALREIIAMGADDAVLLSDKYFAGSDTASTAKVLAAAINTKFKNFDLIICGQYASDGDTAQTGPSLSQNLNIPVITNVLNIEQINGKRIIVNRMTDYGIETAETVFPVLICVTKNNEETRIPKIAGRIKAQDYAVPVLNAENIGIKADKVGFKGSPTTVKKAYNPVSDKNCKIYADKTSEQYAEIILSEIKEEK